MNINIDYVNIQNHIQFEEIETGNIDDAITQFYDHVENHPNNAYLYKELGDLYRRQQQYEKARDSYLQAEARGFDTASLYRNLAICHERLKEDRQAEANFKAAAPISRRIESLTIGEGDSSIIF